MNHLYNEIEPNAAEWLGNLAAAGEIPQGKIDVRPIQEIDPEDLVGVTQFHTFAGIGGWPLALRLAGWTEDDEVWTGSCPCQPFSSAGKGGGVEDERHLWPDFFRLIKERRPSTIFGEQVGSKAGIGWLDGVQADLEGEGYACGAVIVGAHSVGAPHIRQRIYWVASLDADGRMAQDADGLGRGRGRDGDSAGDNGQIQAQGLRAVGGVEISQCAERQEFGRPGEAGGAGPHAESTGSNSVSGLGDPTGVGQCGGGADRPVLPAEVLGPRHKDIFNPWSDFRIVPCTDGKARRTGARVFPLAHGIPRGVGDGGAWRKGLARGASRARIGMLRGSGNAIVPVLAAEFIKTFMELEGR